MFWTLFAFSSIIFLLPYLMLYPAFLKLRAVDAQASRPYTVPGGKPLALIISIVGMLFILQAIVFFVWVPGEAMDWAYAVPVLIGVLVTLLVGEILLVVSRRKA